MRGGTTRDARAHKDSFVTKYDESKEIERGIAMDDEINEMIDTHNIRVQEFNKYQREMKQMKRDLQQAEVFAVTLQERSHKRPRMESERKSIQYDLKQTMDDIDNLNNEIKEREDYLEQEKKKNK